MAFLEAFLFPLSRDGMSKHFAHERQPAQSNRSGHARVSRKAAKAIAPIMRPPMRNGMLKCEWSPVRLKYSPRRPLLAAGHRQGFAPEDLASAKFSNKPGEVRREGTPRRWLDPFDCRRRQNDKRAILLEFSKSAAIKSEKLPEYSFA